MAVLSLRALFASHSFVYAEDSGEALRVVSLDSRVSLGGTWKMRTADDPRFALPEFDDSAWDTVRLPGSFMRAVHEKTGGDKGVLWLRKTVYISRDLSGRDIGLILGRIAHADETFFNGEKIGGMGDLPPGEHSMWNHPRHYLVPRGLVRYGADNVIAVRVYYHIYGEILGDIALAGLDEWKSDRNLSYFINIILCYVIIAMGIPLFIIFLFFFIKRPESQEYLFYFLQLMFGLFIVLDLCNYWNIYGSTLTRFKVLGSAWLALNVAHPFFLHRIYDLKRKKTEIVLVVILVAILFIGMPLTSERLLRINGLLYIAITAHIGWYNLSCHVSALYKKRPYSKLFSFFGILVILGAIHDGFIYFIKFAFLDANILGPAFQNMIFYLSAFPLYMGTSLVLVTRFVRMMDEVEELNTSLESFIFENALLSEKLKKSNGFRKKAYHAITGSWEEKIGQVVGYINQNFTYDLSREGLAATLDVHPDNLGKLFKMATGKKMGDYINELRVKEAARMLTETEDSIIDIAFSVGFDSIRTFNRVFLKFMETTPAKYRMNVKSPLSK